jgi:hypothetical protein
MPGPFLLAHICQDVPVKGMTYPKTPKAGWVAFLDLVMKE